MSNFENRDMLLEVGLNIAFYRRRKGMSQETLAEMTQISRSHLGSIEAPNVVHPFSLDVLFSIAAALELEPYKLLVVRE